LTASGGDTYEWSTGETTQSITVSPDITTTYTVTVSNAVTSDSDSVVVTVEDCSTAIEGPADFEFLVFPNPTNGPLSVKIAGVEKDAVLSVYTILGHEVVSQNIPSNGGQVQIIELNLSSRARGFYMVRLHGEDVSLTKKIILR